MTKETVEQMEKRHMRILRMIKNVKRNHARIAMMNRNVAMTKDKNSIHHNDYKWAYRCNRIAQFRTRMNQLLIDELILSKV